MNYSKSARINVTFYYSISPLPHATNLYPPFNTVTPPNILLPFREVLGIFVFGL